MDDSKGIETAPALGVSLNAQYAAGRQIVFQTHVAQDTPPEQLNRLLDTMNAVVDRAEAYYAQDQAQRQLEVEKNAAANIVRRLEEVEGNSALKATADGRRNPKTSAQDEVAKKQAYDSVVESKRRIAECEKHLADLIRKAGNRDASTSPADR